MHACSRALLVCSFLVGLSTVAGAATITFINEIHYDNSGTDTGEAIEVAGPAGTDLSTWSLVLYNGATQLVYDTLGLSGILPAQQNGFGTLSFPSLGLQNGAPDGIALVHGGSVVQFLSYEGTFTALDGPASGLTSVSLGHSESSSTPVGYSLQLKGQETIYEDFSWSAASAASFGSVNTAQLFAPDPWINELHYDNAGADAGEAIEIAGVAGFDLAGWKLVLYNGATGATYDTIALGGILSDQLSGFGMLPFAAPGLQNGSPDGIALVDPTGAVVQFLSYEGAFTVHGGGGARGRSPQLRHRGVRAVEHAARVLAPAAGRRRGSGGLHLGGGDREHVRGAEHGAVLRLHDPRRAGALGGRPPRPRAAGAPGARGTAAEAVI